MNFPLLDGDVPHSTSYGVYMSQINPFARMCSNVDDFNNRNLFLTAKLFKQDYRYKIQEVFSKFYHRHSELTLNAPIATKVICFSCLLKCLRSIYGKQCGPRSDCSYRSSLFLVHSECFYT